ncbi:MAG: O-antigen ligase family protein [Bacteroidetes bacterium]|nr:O-antigen ligase family protein [Bacteroidota bacterium]
MQRSALILPARRGLRLSLAVMIAGILFSIALSSVAFVVVGVCFALLVAGEGRAALRRSGLEYPMLVWAAAVLVMVVFAMYPASSLLSAKRLLLLLIVFILPAAFTDARSLRWLLLVLAITAGLQSLVGIVQHLWAGSERLGLFQHYMTGGGMRMLLLLLFLPLLFDPETPRRERTLLIAAATLMLVALLFTMTRSSWLGFAAGALLIAVLRYRLLLPVLAGGVVLLFLLAPQQYRDRLGMMFTTQKSELRGEAQGEAVVQSNQARLRMWRTGWQMFLEHPVTGVGDGEMHAIYRTYVPDAIKDEGGHLHNTYIHVLATHGVIGAAALLLLLGAVGLRLWRSWRRHRGNAAGTLVLGAIAAFVGFLVNGMAEYNFGDHEIVLLLWTVVGIALTAESVAFRWSDTKTERV